MLRRTPHCMVVIPEEGLRNLIDDMLSTSGFTVEQFDNDAAALKYLTGSGKVAPVDVIVCRAPEPGAKNPLVARVRNGELTSSKPVICLSHSNGLQDRTAAFEAGCTEYVLRPVSPTFLEERVQYWASRNHRAL